MLISLSILVRSLLTGAFSRMPREFLWKPIPLAPFELALVGKLDLCQVSPAQGFDVPAKALRTICLCSSDHTLIL